MLPCDQQLVLLVLAPVAHGHGLARVRGLSFTPPLPSTPHESSNNPLDAQHGGPVAGHRQSGARLPGEAHGAPPCAQRLRPCPPPALFGGFWVVACPRLTRPSCACALPGMWRPQEAFHAMRNVVVRMQRNRPIYEETEVSGGEYSSLVRLWRSRALRLTSKPNGQSVGD